MQAAAKMSISRTPIRCLRSLHTSAARAREPSLNPSEIFNARLANSRSPQAPGLKSAAQEAAEKRKNFVSNSIIAPQAFSEESLFPAHKPNARPPLLGPPRKVAELIDPFYITKTNPMIHDLNPHYAYEFVGQMGKLKGRAETGLTWKSQRRVGKLVRRARAMGVISRWTNRPVPGGLGSPEAQRQWG